MATQDDNGQDQLRLTPVAFRLLADDSDDDSGEWNSYEGVYDDADTDAKRDANNARPETQMPQHLTVFPQQSSDEVILKVSKDWVRKGTFFTFHTSSINLFGT